MVSNGVLIDGDIGVEGVNDKDFVGVAAFFIPSISKPH